MTKRPSLDHHQFSGKAGDSVRHYQPRRNWNRIINWLVCGERLAFSPVQSAIITQLKKVPDVSFWQGAINWDVMRSKTDAVIIRAAQNIWADSMFLINYQAAKARGMKRGIYFFYDDRKSPGEQAAKLTEIIGGDLPEMEIWIDWENSYGGQFGTLRDVVAMMQVVERAFPTVGVGTYTGYYWFVEHSNAIANAAQYTYLKSRPLWLAWYGDAAAVKIPAPWDRLTFWQFGTPAEDWGQATYEIDMSFFNGTPAEFYSRYGGEVTEPPITPPGDPMKATVKTGYTLMIRDAAGADTGKRLKGGDVVYGEVANSRISFERVYRLSGVVEPIAGSAATVNPQNAAEAYVALTNETEPPVTPPADEIFVSVDCDITAKINGAVYHGVVLVENVQLKPQ